jgi:hypothetical protein
VNHAAPAWRYCRPNHPIRMLPKITRRRQRKYVMVFTPGMGEYGEIEDFCNNTARAEAR